MEKKDKKTGTSTKSAVVKKTSAAKKKSSPVKSAVKKPAAAKPAVKKSSVKKPAEVKLSRAKKTQPKSIVEPAKIPAEEKIAGADIPEVKEESENKITSAVKNIFSDKDDDNSPGMVGVLDRFRSKIIVLLILFMITTGIAFGYSDTLLYYLNKPFLESGNKLNIFTLMGGFMIKFKISAAAAIFVLVPFIIYQIWSLINPSLTKNNRMFSRLTIIAAIILFYSGVAFVFFLLLPAAIKVMLSFVGNDMLSTIGADNYLSFILFFSLSMGILFEVPVIILVLTRMGIISPAMLTGKRKYAIVIIWIIAAVITPQPDPFSQAMVGVPLMIIYEISIIISKIVAASNMKRIKFG